MFIKLPACARHRRCPSLPRFFSALPSTHLSAPPVIPCPSSDGGISGSGQKQVLEKPQKECSYHADLSNFHLDWDKLPWFQSTVIGTQPCLFICRVPGCLQAEPLTWGAAGEPRGSAKTNLIGAWPFTGNVY